MTLDAPGQLLRRELAVPKISRSDAPEIITVHRSVVDPLGFGIDRDRIQPTTCRLQRTVILLLNGCPAFDDRMDIFRLNARVPLEHTACFAASDIDDDDRRASIPSEVSQEQGPVIRVHSKIIVKRAGSRCWRRNRDDAVELIGTRIPSHYSRDLATIV
jgi:hypothetical protein